MKRLQHAFHLPLTLTVGIFFAGAAAAHDMPSMGSSAASSAASAASSAASNAGSNAAANAASSAAAAAASSAVSAATAAARANGAGRAGGRAGGGSPDDPYANYIPNDPAAIQAALNAPPDPVDPGAAARKVARDRIAALQNEADRLQDQLRDLSSRIDRAWATRLGGGFPPITSEESKRIDEAGGVGPFIQNMRNQIDALNIQIGQNDQNMKAARSAATQINAWQDAY